MARQTSLPRYVWMLWEGLTEMMSLLQYHQLQQEQQQVRGLISSSIQHTMYAVLIKDRANSGPVPHYCECARDNKSGLASLHSCLD